MELDKKQKSQWHSLSHTAVLDFLKSSAEGNSSKEAAERLKKEGSNTLFRRGRESVFIILVRQFSNPLSILTGESLSAEKDILECLTVQAWFLVKILFIKLI